MNAISRLALATALAGVVAAPAFAQTQDAAAGARPVAPALTAPASSTPKTLHRTLHRSVRHAAATSTTGIDAAKPAAPSVATTMGSTTATPAAPATRMASPATGSTMTGQPAVPSGSVTPVAPGKVTGMGGTTVPGTTAPGTSATGTSATGTRAIAPGTSVTADPHMQGIVKSN